MQKNVGFVDKTIRLVIALAAFWAYHTEHFVSTTATVVLVAGVVVLLSAVYSFCAIYKLIGINTCGKCCHTNSDEK